jgi:hypothetical protein
MDALLIPSFIPFAKLSHIMSGGRHEKRASGAGVQENCSYPRAPGVRGIE